jgi:hypothetical protein
LRIGPSTSLALLLTVSCQERGETRAHEHAPLRSAAAPTSSASGANAAKPVSLDGTWIRDSEPYRGMVVELASREGNVVGKVVKSPDPSEERVAARAAEIAAARRAKSTSARDRQRAGAELACQATLWRPNDPYFKNGRLVVRDWGLTPSCEHRDASAPAELVLTAPDALEIRVTRGKTTTTQHWSRGPASAAP